MEVFLHNGPLDGQRRTVILRGDERELKFIAGYAKSEDGKTTIFHTASYTLPNEAGWVDFIEANES